MIVRLTFRAARESGAIIRAERPTDLRRRFCVPTPRCFAVGTIESFSRNSFPPSMKSCAVFIEGNHVSTARILTKRTPTKYYLHGADHVELKFHARLTLTPFSGNIRTGISLKFPPRPLKKPYLMERLCSSDSFNGYVSDFTYASPNENFWVKVSSKNWGKSDGVFFALTPRRNSVRIKKCEEYREPENQ